MANNPIIQDIVDDNANGGYDYDNFWADLFTGGAATQSDYNEWSTQFQEQQFAYQKWLNEMQMLREDTAYQRKAADLKAAGLHPALALSGGGAGSTALSAGNSVQTPNAGFKRQLGVADLLSLMTATSSIHKSNAEASYAKLLGDKASAEAARIKLENEIMEYDFHKAKADGIYYNKHNGFASDFANVFGMVNDGKFDTKLGDFVGDKIKDFVMKSSEEFSNSSEVNNKVDSMLLDLDKRQRRGVSFMKWLQDKKPKTLSPKMKNEFIEARRALYGSGSDKMRKYFDYYSKLYNIK